MLSLFRKTYFVFLDKVLGDYLKSRTSSYIRSSLLRQYLVFGDEARLEIAKTAIVNNCLFNLESGRIIIGDYVFFGHNVTLVTGTHDYHRFGRERQTSVPLSGRDITIKEGAWLASNVTVIGPCTIGQHAVVAAGSVVNADIPAYSIVAGVPAKVIKLIHPE
jgi:acetyltransferase-like isoleucine patch superfamily enzyme